MKRALLYLAAFVAIAVMLLANAGTKGSDFLVPFEILSRSGAFEVLVAAGLLPRRSAGAVR